MSWIGQATALVRKAKALESRRRPNHGGVRACRVSATSESRSRLRNCCIRVMAISDLLLRLSHDGIRVTALSRAWCPSYSCVQVTAASGSR